MSTKLNKTIGFEVLGGAMVDIAKREAEEAVTRSLIGLGKSKENIKKTAVHVGKAVVAKAIGSYIDNEVIDTAVEVYAGVKLVQAGFSGYKAVKDFSQGYAEATDEDVAKLAESLGIEL